MEDKERMQSPEADWDARAAEVKRKHLALFDLDMMKFYGLFAEFGKELIQKYGEQVNHCRLFHALAGSGESEKMGEWTEFDFPGEDSVEVFINKLYQENIEKK